MVTRAKAKAALVLIAVFLLGALAGASAAHALGRRRMAELVSNDREGLREERRMHALRRALDLTDDQAERVRAVFQKHRTAHRDAMDSMMRDCGQRLEDVRSALDAELAEILTPEQQERFAELQKRHGPPFPMRRGHRRPGLRGPGGPPRPRGP